VIGVAQDATGVNFADLSVEQTREARGLKLWLPLQLLGVDAFRQALDDKLDLARHAAAELARIPGVELVSTPELSTFAFAVRGPADRAQRLVDAINARGAVHLATAPIGGRTVVRVCVISFRTRAEHISTLVQHVREAMNASPAAEEPA
jgi:aromatic-L-amino-acid decarboxylase